MKISGAEWRETRQALCDAFPSRRELERLLNDYFGKNINEIAASNGNLQDTVDDAIQWFLARDTFAELIQAAFNERPHHAGIHKLAVKWNQVPVLPESDHLERILRQANSFLDPEIWYARFKDIVNQVCQIEIKTSAGGRSFGTGVLIAPDTVLTNYHVIECVAAPEKFRQAGHDAAPSDVTIRFDNRRGSLGYIQPGVEFRLKPDWLIASSPYHLLDLQGQPDWTGSIADELDYALLAVAGSPGEQPLLQSATGGPETTRGWVRLNPRITSGVVGMGLIVVQHPEGEALKVGIESEAVLAIHPSEKRIKHRVNTARGSSGAPCFNFNWDLVAIHQAGSAPSGTAAGYNLAIPVAKIIPSLEKKGFIGSSESYR
ncbi:MAG: effector-associated domain EAD1-containing protein [Chloroflexota bacterium]